jgi:type IX secretion system PorP/SprF family membrane protein
MMNAIRLRTMMAICSFLTSTWCLSQDLHYSQFYNSPQNINPAQVGLFNADHRFILSLRDQWRYVPVPWTTLSGAYDRNILSNKSEKTFYGLGGNINYDRQGDSKLTLINLGINGALHRVLVTNWIGSIGANLGFGSRSFNSKALRWDKQWDEDHFDTSILSGETFADNESIFFLETGLGANIRWQKTSRTNADLGLGVLHLIEPTATFLGEQQTKLPRRLTLSGVGNFQLTEKLDLQVHALQQFQSKYRETVFGGLAKIYLNQNRGKELQLHLGLGYRTSGSLIPTVAFQYKTWYLSGNLDVDSTPFNQTLGTSRGAYELHLRHTIKNVKQFRFKNCPLL